MARLIHFDEIRKNNIRTFFLFALFAVLIIVLGLAMGLFIGDNITALIITFFIGFIYGLISWYQGSNILLKTVGAKPVTKKEYPHLYHSVEGLAIAAGIPTPKCYVMKSSSPNAFATGRNPQEGIVVVTTGLMDKLNRQELEGVVAHEIAHIKNYDIRTMLIAAVLIGVVATLSHLLIRMSIFGTGNNRDSRAGIAFLLIGVVLAILTPLVAEMIKFAVSRRREYAADAQAAVLTRNPSGLADALRKISGDNAPLDEADSGNSHLFFSAPKKKNSWFKNLFSTHPPIEERISRLDRM